MFQDDKAFLKEEKKREKAEEARAEISTVQRIIAEQFWEFAHYVPTGGGQEAPGGLEENDVTSEDEGEKPQAKSKSIVAFEPSDNDDVEAPKTACVTVPHTLTEDQKLVMDSVLRFFHHTSTSGQLNVTSVLEHDIDTGDAKPIMRRQYPLSPTSSSEFRKNWIKWLNGA